MSAHAASASAKREAQPLDVLARAALECCWLTVSIGVLIAAVCFYATGGFSLDSATVTEIVLTLGSGALVVAAIAQADSRRAKLWGSGAGAALFLLAGYTALSVGWSVEPSDSWIEASRTFSYAATFAGALALVRLAAGRWRSVIAGVLLATFIVSAYAIATKIFPAGVVPGTVFARLNAPFGYWNVVGLTAALGVPPALWLGARREGHGALVALAPCAVCVFLVTIMLSYSRGALLALVLGVAFWLIFVPLRLRSVSILAIGAIGAAIVTVWTFAQTALTTTYTVPALATSDPTLPARSTAGHELGLVLLGVLVLCAAAALAVRFAALRNPPSAHARHRTGVVLLVCLALVPVVGMVGLAASSRGLFGSISHDVNTLTTTHISVSNSANRLTALGSQRALYWSAAIKAFDKSPLIGSGAGGYQTLYLRYDKTQAVVEDAHGYIFQTLADLGLVGLAVSLLVAALWIAAALRAVGPLAVRSGIRGSESAERIGLLALVTCVVIFAVDSTIDFTWFVPGAMMIALLCAGWVAGRGYHEAALALGRPRVAALRDHRIAAPVAATVVLALIVAWSQWQPLRSQDSVNAAETALATDHFTAARADAETAISENPLDYLPLTYLAVAQADLHHVKAGYATMVRAVGLQPSNANTWYDLANYDWVKLNAPKDALRVLEGSLYLFPQNPDAQTLDETLLLAIQTETPAVKPAAHHRRSKH